MMRKRRDGHRAKDFHGMDQLLIDIKPKAYMREVYLNQDFDFTKLDKYVANKKKEGLNITYFHAILAALGKVIYNRPKLNRFIANRHVYEHDKVIISFVAKVSFEDKAKEIMLLIPIEPDDNTESISKKVLDKLDHVRVKQDADQEGGANGILDVLGALPNFIRVPLLGFLKWMDKHDLLPSSLTGDLLYYSSMMVTNIGTLGCDGIYHNNTDFGTCPSIVSIGEIKDKTRVVDGEVEVYKGCNMGITFDEGCAEGYYLIKSLKLMQYLIDNPDLLDEPANTIYDNYYSKEKKTK